MPSQLVPLITSSEAAVRDQSMDALCEGLSLAALLEECEHLDRFRRETESLYQRVRALFFLAALYRFHLPQREGLVESGHVPYEGYSLLMERRFAEAIEVFRRTAEREGGSETIASALASTYHQLAFQTLADQVRLSVRSVAGNRWMFRLGHPYDQPLRIRKELLERASAREPFPLLVERTPVRMDLTHSAWSDIFFLGMDFPEGAKVINLSVDLGIQGRDTRAEPPIECSFRVIDQPVIRLVSVDLETQKDFHQLNDLFDFAADYLGLLKAALVASGLVPPGLEGSGQRLSDLLGRLLGPGLGFELVSQVRGIPKGSRLAVSTNLLASLISLCMRATSQIRPLEGPLVEEADRRLIAARAILGEWIGGSGGGWQDSGGIWPGIKVICGQPAQEGDVEHGVSRGRLMPDHETLQPPKLDPAISQKLQDSLVVVHGGMAQNVGPILEMVTEKYLLRSAKEWEARQEAIQLLEEVLEALRTGDIQRLGQATTQNFFGPLQTIIPWCSNLFTERLIARCRERYQTDFWGFWMLGGMAGGGMGFIFAPAVKAEAQAWLAEEMVRSKTELQKALPFAIDPVVYDFRLNDQGTTATLRRGPDALLKPVYYRFMLPLLVRQDPKTLSQAQTLELQQLGEICRQNEEFRALVPDFFQRLFPETAEEKTQSDLASLLQENGFDALQHEQIRQDLRSGQIGLAQNRLPLRTKIEDVRPEDIHDLRRPEEIAPETLAVGQASLARGEVAVVTLAAGAGSRWTQGAGVVKGLHPFCKFAGQHRSFLETHLAKSRSIGQACGVYPPHLFTSSYLTEAPLRDFLHHHQQFHYPGPVLISEGRSIGLRLIPMERDLRYAWEETPQQTLDEQAQKVRESAHAALRAWARTAGEGSDYTDNLAAQCLHPVGHWYEIPNLLLNGSLAKLIQEQSNLQYLLLHNIDTVGAHLHPALLGQHIESGSTLSFEVITRCLEDRGGGLARVDGHVELVEGLALPREDAEFDLSYYNSMTTWISLDGLLALFDLTRDQLTDIPRIQKNIRALAQRMPTYLTLKDVKKRWGSGQEDIYPVSQFEKLWSDMTQLRELDCSFFLVPRERGQQLKEQAQLDGWLRDGSAAYVEKLCAW